MLSNKLIKQLKDELTGLGLDLLETPPSDHAGLMKQVGYAAGIKKALQLIEDHLKGKEQD